MTSTLVRDSIVGDDWIRQTAAAVPIQRVIDAAGQFTGDILTGPVRLAFTDTLFALPKDAADDTKYGAALLFTPMADPRILYEEYYACCGREFPQYYDQQSQQYHGLHSPFHDQAEKSRFGGFTPGAFYFNSSSQYKPPICDTRFNPIVDPNKVYPGVWAVCTVRPFAYGKVNRTDGKPTKRGVGFGLQSVMIIADDTRFGGGAPDPRDHFKGVNISAPIVRPDIGQHMPQGGAPAPAGGIPGYTAPGGGVPQPGQPPQGFNMPQQHYQMPAQQPGNYAAAQPMGQPQQNFQPPGAPAGNNFAPPMSNAPGGATGATTYPSNGYDPNDPMFRTQ